MDLESRLRELRAAGDDELAESLAKGAVGSQTIEDISLTPSGVRVELSSFTGVHPTVPAGQQIKDDDVDVAELSIKRGEYSLKSGEVELRVEMGAVHSDAIREWMERNHDESESEGVSEEESVGGDVIFDGEGTEEDITKHEVKEAPSQKGESEGSSRFGSMFSRVIGR